MKAPRSKRAAEAEATPNESTRAKLSRENLNAGTVRRTDRYLKRRSTILEAARQLAAQKGYDDLTMLDIARASDVSAKTLYNIYGSKDRLLLAAVQERSEEIFGELSLTTSRHGWDRMVELLDRASEGIGQSPGFTRAVAALLFGQWDWSVTNAHFEGQYRLALQEIRDKGELKPETDIEVLTRLMRFQISAVVLLWAREDISDRQLPVFYRLVVCQILAGLTLGGTREAVEQMQSKALAALSKMKNVVPPGSADYACPPRPRRSKRGTG